MYQKLLFLPLKIQTFEKNFASSKHCALQLCHLAIYSTFPDQ